MIFCIESQVSSLDFMSKDSPTAERSSNAYPVAVCSLRWPIHSGKKGSPFLNRCAALTLISPRCYVITMFEGRSLIWSYNNKHNSQKQHSAASFRTSPSPHLLFPVAPEKSITASVIATELVRSS